MERVANQNRELRRKHRTLQTQVRTLCDERADFLVRLQDQQRDIGALRQRLGLAQKENEDLAKVVLIDLFNCCMYCIKVYLFSVNPLYRVTKPSTIWTTQIGHVLQLKN